MMSYFYLYLENEDYVGFSVQLVFEIGDREKCFNVTANNDSLLEESERFRMVLIQDNDRILFNPDEAIFTIIDKIIGKQT